MYDLLIVGGGPAGLTATLYAIRKGLNALLVSENFGGKTNYNLALPDGKAHHGVHSADIVKKFWQTLNQEAFAHCQDRVTVVSKESDLFTVQMENHKPLQAKSLIFATGSRMQRLGVPGEEVYASRGLSYSAISYASLFADKNVAVIGDAKLALRAVAELALVANTVHLIVPAPTHDVMETPLLQKLVAADKIVVWEGCTVKEITGNDYAERVVLTSVEGDVYEVAADGIFIELRLDPNSNPIKTLVDLNSAGFVMVDNLNRTSCPGLFAAGDVTNACAEQILIAVGEGAKAALSAYDYLLPLFSFA